MIRNLLNWFGPKSADTIKSCPTIQGHVTVQLFDLDGKLKKETQGFNIWTLTGREYLTELISLQSFSLVESSRQVHRKDRVAYIGMGIGSQVEASGVSSLVSPVSYDTGVANTGKFLALLDTPVTFPSTNSTAVQFSKTFGATDFSASAGSSVVLTEAGLFTDGDPGQNFQLGTDFTDWQDSSSFAPVAYKTFEPITKTQDFTMKIVWEVRFL